MDLPDDIITVIHTFLPNSYEFYLVYSSLPEYTRRKIQQNKNLLHFCGNNQIKNIKCLEYLKNFFVSNFHSNYKSKFHSNYKFNDEVAFYASRSNNLSLFKWASENYMVDRTNSDWIHNFIDHDSSEAIKYAVEIKCYFDRRAFTYACSTNLKLVKCLLDNIKSDFRKTQFLVDGIMCALIECEDKLDIIEFILSTNMCNIDSSFLAIWFVKKNYNLEWLINKGYKWTIMGINYYLNQKLGYYPTLTPIQEQQVRQYASSK
jgi:hypothetical protein